MNSIPVLLEKASDQAETPQKGNAYVRKTINAHLGQVSVSNTKPKNKGKDKKVFSCPYCKELHSNFLLLVMKNSVSNLKINGYLAVQAFLASANVLLDTLIDTT